MSLKLLCFAVLCRLNTSNVILQSEPSDITICQRGFTKYFPVAENFGAQFYKHVVCSYLHQITNFSQSSLNGKRICSTIQPVFTLHFVSMVWCIDKRPATKFIGPPPIIIVTVMCEVQCFGHCRLHSPPESIPELTAVDRRWLAINKAVSEFSK